MKIPFNDLSAHHRELRGEIQAAITSVIDRSAFIDGEEVRSFENNFARFCGGGECAAVSNGTDALALALMALGLAPGDEVIVPTQTFVATVEPIFHMGARPVFVDSDPATHNIDPSQIEKAITPRTKGIIAVHLYGYPAEMTLINQVARNHGLWVLEDSAQAHGASIDGIRTGLLGDLATFSFFPGKNLGAFGDAGAVVSKNPQLIAEVRRLKNHGREPGAKYEHMRIGFNYRMDTLQAAILDVKLKYLEQWTTRRREIGSYYSSQIGEVARVPTEAAGFRHVYHLYVIEVARRAEFARLMAEQGIQTGIHYPIPTHQHAPVVKLLSVSGLSFPIAESSAERVLSLPIFPEMSDSQVEYVAEKTIQTIRKVGSL